MQKYDSVALIMAGGTGTRFWPRSRKSFPKQYLSLFGKQSLIQETVNRLSPLLPAEKIFICAAEGHKAVLEKQLPHITNCLLEPEGKNTAPCLIYSTVELLRSGLSPATVMVTLPADHFIAQPAVFQDLIKKAVHFAFEQNCLVTLGIYPTHPHVGYGYIEAGDAVETHDEFFKVRRFIEKPTRPRAEKLFHQKDHYWNGGIFVWTLHALAEAFQKFMPAEWELMNSYRTRKDLAKIYSELHPASIDTAVLEKADNVYVVPADMGWNDLGSWSAIYDLHNKTPQDHVVLSNNIVTVQSRGCLIDAPRYKKIALVGVENLIVIESEETLLIANRDQDQLVREVSELSPENAE